MITNSPYGITNVIRPGWMPEPLQPVHTCDPEEIIAVCLKCPVEGECHPELSICPLNRRNKDNQNAKPSKRTIARAERDEKLLYLLTHGWRNTECICEELGIKKAALCAAKKRLRERGEIP